MHPHYSIKMTSATILASKAVSKRTAKLKFLEVLRAALAHCWMPIVFFLWFYNMNALVVLINSQYTIDSSKSLVNNTSFLGHFFDSLYPSRTVKADSILCVLVNVWTQKIILIFIIALDTVVYSLIFIMQLEFAYKRINFTAMKLLSLFDNKYESYLRVVFDNAFLRFFVLYLSSMSNLLFGLTTTLSSSEGMILFGYNFEPNYLENNMFLFYLFGALPRYILAGVTLAGIVLKKYHNRVLSESKKIDEIAQFKQFMYKDYKNKITEEYHSETTIRINRPDYVIKVQPQKFFKIRFFESRKYICLNEIDDDIVMDVDYLVKRIQYKYNKLELVLPPFRNPFARIGFSLMSLNLAINVVLGFILWVTFVVYHKDDSMRLMMMFSLIGPIILTFIAVCVRLAPEKVQPIRSASSVHSIAKKTSILKDKLSLINSDRMYDNSTDLPSTERRSLLKNSDDIEFFNKLTGFSAKVHPLKSTTTNQIWDSKHSY